MDDEPTLKSLERRLIATEAHLWRIERFAVLIATLVACVLLKLSGWI